ncbi:hypothetical protein HYV84_08045 [Candidatus Woesearchaeota archaeon]|nr:hypothetical protein [Candidatus Woesearchaeota archaeon]
MSSNAFEVTSQNQLKTDVSGRQILVLRAQLEGMKPTEERVSFEVIPQPAPEPLQVQFGGINPIEGEKGTQLQLTGYVRTNKPVYYQWVKWKVMADGNIDKSGDYLSGVFFESPTGEKYNPIKILHTFQDTGRFRIFIYHGVEPGKLILKSPIGDIEIKDSSKGRGVPNLHASTLQPQPNQPIPQGFSSAITQPSQDVELMEAQTIEFVGKVTGGVPPFRIWWRNYGTPYSDGKTISENPPMQELNNAGETRISFKFSEKGVYRITLYVTDSENKKNSSERKVDFSLNPF